MKIEFEVTRKRVLTALLLIIVLTMPSFMIGTNIGYNVGHKEGYLDALTDVRDKTGIEFDWIDLGNGRYQIIAYQDGQLTAKGTAEIHCWVEHWRDGKLLSIGHHPGNLTDIGKDWLEDQISDSPSTTPAAYISTSGTDTSGWSNHSTWTIIPDEINANGLTRALGTYVSTGTGTWNVSKTFSVTGTQTVQTYGLNWSATPLADNTLLCNDISTAKNCNNGDTLKVTWQVAVT